MVLYLILNRTTVENYPNLDCSTLFQRHKMATMLRLLASRGDYMVVNYVELTNFNPNKEPKGKYILSLNIDMQTATLDYEAFGHLGRLDINDEESKRIHI